MRILTSNNETQLVKELAKGNLLAFNTLYNQYSGRLYRFSLGYLKTVEEAEELVQEVFTIIWERRTDLKAELSFRAFLFTIAFNIIRKHFRTKAYLLHYFESQAVPEGDMGTSQSVTYDSLKQCITELVARLPARCKEIFIKSRFEGLTIREIAQELGISHKTVENQLTEALRFLRTHLNREELSVFLFFMLFLS